MNLVGVFTNGFKVILTLIFLNYAGKLSGILENWSNLSSRYMWGMVLLTAPAIVAFWLRSKLLKKIVGFGYLVVLICTLGFVIFDVKNLLLNEKNIGYLILMMLVPLVEVYAKITPSG